MDLSTMTEVLMPQVCVCVCVCACLRVCIGSAGEVELHAKSLCTKL